MLIPIGTTNYLQEELRDIPPFKRLLRMNSPEWHYIAIGSVGALFTGALQPCFALIMAEIMGVSFSIH